MAMLLVAMQVSLSLAVRTKASVQHLGSVASLRAVQATWACVRERERESGGGG